MKKLFENIYISVFIISVITTHIYINYMGLGFAAIELGLFPLLIVLSRKYKILIGKDLLTVVLFIGVLSALSMIFLNSEQLPTIWKVIRSYCLFFIAFFFFFRNDFSDWEKVYTVSIISVLFDILSSFLHANYYVTTTDQQYAVLINILLPIFVIGYSYLNKSKLHFIVVCLLCLIDAFFSVTRGNVLYVLITIFSAVALLDSKQTISRIVLVLVLGAVVVNLYLSFEDTLERYSPNMHYRLYTKVLEREDANTGDEVRKDQLVFLIDHFDYCAIPHGLPSRESRLVDKERERLMWSVRDCSLNELVYTYGLLGYFVPFLLLIGAFRLYKKHLNSSINKVFCLCFLIIDAYLFTGYGLLSTPSTVVYLGMIVGSSFRLLQQNTNENAASNITNINSATISL